MFYDLNVQWSQNEIEVQRTLSFLAELGYNAVALNTTLSGKLPSEFTCAIPEPLPFSPSPKLRILRRCTLITTDPSQNYRIAELFRTYDLVAIRPTDETSLQQACNNLDCDLISLDLTARIPYLFKFRTLGVAIERGIKFEICYAPGVLATDSSKRRNLISNATQLIRATRGRGLVISSEAAGAVGCRGPWDVINLATVWGLSQEKGKEALTKLARHTIVSAQLRRTSYRGVIDIVYGGEVPERTPKTKDKSKQTAQQKKRKGLESSEQADTKSDMERETESDTMTKGKKTKLHDTTAEAGTEDITMRPD